MNCKRRKGLGILSPENLRKHYSSGRVILISECYEPQKCIELLEKPSPGNHAALAAAVELNAKEFDSKKKTESSVHKVTSDAINLE